MNLLLTYAHVYIDDTVTDVAKHLVSCWDGVGCKEVKVLCMHQHTFQKTPALAVPPHFGHVW
jgi:hypothetical protein